MIHSKDNYLCEINSFQDIKIENDVERLLILRKRLNMSQFAFAKELDISPSYISQVERYQYPFNHLLKERIQNYIKKGTEWNAKDFHRSL